MSHGHPESGVGRSATRVGWQFPFLALLALMGCGTGSTPSTSKAARPEIDEQAVVQFCGNCHRFSEPASFARHEWRGEVEKAYAIHRDSGRFDLRPPPREAVIAWYESRAPESLLFDPSEQLVDRDTPGSLQFTARPILAPDDLAPAIARFGSDFNSGEILAADMAGGGIWQLDIANERVDRKTATRHPAGIMPARLGPDRQPGWIIPDLGSFLPSDHHDGGLWWLPDSGGEPVPLVTGLGRVSHVLVTDIDGDGHDDLVVSEFGWRKTGRLSVYWNRPEQGPWPHLVPEVIDPRHGPLKAVTADLDHDGKAEIVAAFAQEFESLDRYDWSPETGFRQTRLYESADPSAGTSDFEVVDLDADGKLDVILCQGDSFDSPALRPNQGITWLRQTASGTFDPVLVTRMPGVHRAVPGDLDGDGDLDLAAVALLPDPVLADPSRPKLASVVWLEQTAPGQFMPHVLEWDRCTHATCEVMDVNGDGRLDILAGEFVWSGTGHRIATVFINDGAR
jgi:hypothetical protein